jgi:hypothetical protein
MDLLITEHQFKKIILESNFDKFQSYIKTLNDFSSKIIKVVRTKYSLNLKLLSTWGTAVGGLVMPLDNFIRSGNFNVTDDQISLILVGVASFVFFENKALFQQIYQKIVKEGVRFEFKEVLLKATQLKSVFFKFLNSLNVTFLNVSELAAYAFLLPIVTDIVDLLNYKIELEEIAMMTAKRIVATGLVLVSGESLYTVIKKILQKFT